MLLMLLLNKFDLKLSVWIQLFRSQMKICKKETLRQFSHALLIHSCSEKNMPFKHNEQALRSIRVVKQKFLVGEIYS